MKRLKHSTIRSLLSTTFVVFLLVMFLFFSDFKNCGNGVRQLIVYSVMIKSCLQMPFDLIGYFLVKRKIISRLWLTLLSFFLMIFLFVWYTHVTIMFFRKDNDCRQVSKSLYSAHVVLLVEAAIIYFIFAVFTLITCCALFVIIFTAKMEHNQKKQNVKIKNVLLGLTALKLNPTEYSEEDCIICCEQFQENQDIIRLPWDPRHYFHPQWIGPWLEKEASCPLCKQEITMDQLKSIQSKINTIDLD